MPNAPEKILQDILGDVVKNGLHSADRDSLKSSLYRDSPDIKSDNDLRRWAKENNLRVEETEVTVRGKKKINLVFSRN